MTRPARCNAGVALALLPALLAGPGCSFIFVEGPPPASASAMTVECTTNRILPIIDTIVAITQGLRIGYAVAASDADYQMLGPKISRGWDVATGAALLGLFGTSAVVGYTRVSECRAAKAVDRADEIRRHGADQLRRMRRLQQQRSAPRSAEEPPTEGQPHEEPAHEGPPHEGPPHEGPPHEGPLNEEPSPGGPPMDRR